MKLFLLVEDEAVSNIIVGRDDYGSENPAAVEQTGDLDGVAIGWYRHPDGTFHPGPFEAPAEE
ncbi:hypothetical protein SAMN06297251_10141 [Fulvimarina manganoxydans]|uniref:Uncharacterized protein n=1 Tax=Fulvimarina manganoxydans TaxID=937218 RepID=A0A1W1Y8M6_9HYPH|nr:hypothetical protein [Fulvimarina manganoxydans]SMC32503.1 hypothetical protein SAMN06297251_10141 [Fulvimarina manganoxydans]